MGSSVGRDINSDSKIINAEYVDMRSDVSWRYPEEYIRWLQEQLSIKMTELEEAKKENIKLREQYYPVDVMFGVATTVVGTRCVSVSEYILRSCLYIKDNNYISDFENYVLRSTERKNA